ncbi:unnamed protein product [Polarella glacialis]|uniref:Ammonium transporter n=1 Tax=Polarella glacialis TaxID=89957 RepID=A0A813J4D2_POLGL|nr:unnamed protein product [Polarella glacialis]
MASVGSQLEMSAGISSEDTSYMIANTGLVLFMTPGLALFYGGLVRQKAATDMMLQNFVAMGFMSLMWFFIGFSMSFGTGKWVGGWQDFFMWQNVMKHEPWPLLTISGEVFATFQMMFAIITPVLMTGAFADRMRFGPYLLFLALWSIFVYYPWCHQIWGGGWLQSQGVWDFAGGIVVHCTAGWSALATALALGPRRAKLQGNDLGEPHSVPIVLIGTGILWFGWFGFNGGSAMGINEVAVTAVTNSHLSAAAAVSVWGVLDWMAEGKPKLVPLCIACVAGLVVVTPSCGYIQPAKAIFTGCFAGFVCFDAIRLLKKSGVDDALDVWGVHGVGGACGTILIGILADGPECLELEHPEYCVFPKTVARSLNQVGLQLVGVVLCMIWSFLVTFIILKTMMKIMKVRPDEAQYENLDEELHGEPSYTFHEDFFPGESCQNDSAMLDTVSTTDSSMAQLVAKR